MQIDLRNIHDVLEQLGFPIEEVTRNPADESITVILTRKASEGQRMRSQSIVNQFVNGGARGEFAEFAAAYQTAFDALPQRDDIDNAKKLDELRGMALALRDYIDQHVH